MPIPEPVPYPGATYDVNEKPPPFGHPLKKYFALDDDYVNLNNGSYGSQPLPVVFAATRLAHEIERNPDKFQRLMFQPILVKTRESVAKIIGAEADEVVVVPNATHALNTVLRNFEWREGDLIINTSTTYGAVSNTIRYLTDRSDQPRPDMVTIPYVFPRTNTEIIDQFRATLREVKQRRSDTAFTDVPPISPGYSEDTRGKGNKIVAVIDSIVANPGVLMPWQELVRICREEGVWSVIDAAHSIGQEADINLGEAKPDFWLSNCHKWLFAKRGCAVLYVPKRNQYIIRSSIPTSHEYVSPHSEAYEVVGTNFVKQHEWTGTADTTNYLTVPEAIAFREWLGGEKAIYEYTHKLAIDGGKRLSEVLGTRVMDETGEQTATMTDVQLPLPVEKTRGEVYTNEQLAEINQFLLRRLLLEWKTYAAHYYHAGGWWCRCSAQVFNEISDFEYLGKAFKAVCKEIEETILAKKP
ncbi:PLP-dependent transferase [Trametes polyzona]|nr:PLP-dependent transferase [Trametes polyzona]